LGFLKRLFWKLEWWLLFACRGKKKEKNLHYHALLKDPFKTEKNVLQKELYER